MKRIDSICGVVSRTYAIAAGLFLVVIVVACIVQVYTRYITAHALAWTEEAARYSFAWCMMLAAVPCCRARAHSGVTLLNDFLPGKLKPVHQLLLDAAFVLFGALMLIYGIVLAKNQASVISPLLHVPMWAVYMAVPVGGAGLALISVNNMLLDIGAIMRPADELAADGR